MKTPLVVVLAVSSAAHALSASGAVSASLVSEAPQLAPAAHVEVAVTCSETGSEIRYGFAPMGFHFEKAPSENATPDASSSWVRENTFSFEKQFLPPGSRLVPHVTVGCMKGNHVVTSPWAHAQGEAFTVPPFIGNVVVVDGNVKPMVLAKPRGTESLRVHVGGSTYDFATGDALFEKGLALPAGTHTLSVSLEPYGARSNEVQVTVKGAPGAAAPSPSPASPGSESDEPQQGCSVSGGLLTLMALASLARMRRR